MGPIRSIILNRYTYCYNGHLLREIHASDDLFKSTPLSEWLSLCIGVLYPIHHLSSYLDVASL